jgi:hypothetical protein
LLTQVLHDAAVAHSWQYPLRETDSTLHSRLTVYWSRC